MKVKKLTAMLLAAAMAVSMLAGCGSQNNTAQSGSSGEAQTAESSGSGKDTVVIVTSGDPGRLRSDTLNSLKEIPFNRMAYDYLFTRNRSGEYEACICKEYKLDDDNLGVTMNLRDDVKFHDGNVMTADDVLASLEYGMKDTASGSQLDFIDFDNSKVVDDNTLYLKFNRINGVWQSAFLAIGIIERSAY